MQDTTISYYKHTFKKNKLSYKCFLLSGVANGSIKLFALIFKNAQDTYFAFACAYRQEFMPFG